MTDYEVNIAIAEAVGLPKPFHKSSNPGISEVFDGERKLIPNYCDDLNAMHKAEQWLFHDQLNSWKEYTDWLIAICSYPIFYATARRRAEAFLRVKGLWNEDK